MADKTNKNKEKNHADFQDKYRRSSNFGRSEKDANMKVEGDGTLKSEKEKKGVTNEQKKEIEDVTNSFGEDN
ncbi:hypothetical protein [Autumnicola musiva]|uniref:Uncharacterized protein n=1 Tax=Autumnicola musiva TaxID=3075589 RepID=A0ABU3D7N6_9FLAO|nr:hypothetical protein [Zunongwangia sp. F117]MDT0677013.1 hypothetical protein [Zunongwangia sp. F117]